MSCGRRKLQQFDTVFAPYQHEFRRGLSNNQQAKGSDRKTRMKRLLRAIEGNDSVVAEQLLEAHPQLATRLATVDHYYSRDINHRLAVDDTALHLAAAGYRCEIVRASLGAGADANANGRNNASLHYAAEGYINVTTWKEPAQLATIDCLLKHGADIDIQDKNGATPLHNHLQLNFGRRTTGGTQEAWNSCIAR